MAEGPGDEPPPGPAREAWLEARNREAHENLTAAQARCTSLIDEARLGNAVVIAVVVVLKKSLVKRPAGGGVVCLACSACCYAPGEIYEPLNHTRDCVVGDLLDGLHPVRRLELARLVGTA